MSISQPSHVIYTVDVPECKNLTANFNYNFYVPDEGINDTGGLPANILARPGYEVDSSFIQYAVTRAPRFVKFSWAKPKLADVGGGVSEQTMRDNAFRTTGEQNGSLIADNLDKVVSEDNFSLAYFTSINFHDGQIDDKIYQLVSGSITQQTLEDENNNSSTNSSGYQSAQRLISVLPGYIQPHWIFRGMTQPITYGASFNTSATGADGYGNPSGYGNLSEMQYSSNDFFGSMQNFSINTQINNKLMYDLVDRAVSSPGNMQAVNLLNMHQYAKSVQQSNSHRFTPSVSESDYKTYVPYINVQRYNTTPHAEKYGATIVGYIIDKFEVLPDGTTKSYPPIVIDSPHVNVSADFSVKFNAVYCYTIRTVALYKLPAIDDDTGEIATLRILVTSKPSNKVYAETVKLDPPPPPNDVRFTWNYETNQLLVTWAFPVTSERDVKQFQVFRRRSTKHCFELQKVYNFDDNVTPWPPEEYPDPTLVERLTSPASYWIDEEFDRTVNTSRRQGFIYALAAIDAHQLTSNYSAQYLVWFDPFQNALQMELVSHSGAPKPYPNLYLNNQLFQDTINVNGPHSKQMLLYFNPDYYYLTDDRNRYIKLLSTQQMGGSYQLQFINTDSGKDTTINITIDDRISATVNTVQSTIQFGPQR